MPTLGPTSFDPDLHLTIGEHVYTVGSPLTYEEGKRLRLVVADTGLPVSEQVNEAIKILGDDLIEEMMDNGVAWTHVLHAGRTALLHFGFSPDVAKLHWGMAQLGSMVDIENMLTTLTEAQASRRERFMNRKQRRDEARKTKTGSVH